MASDAAPRYVERKDKSRGVSVLSGDKMTLFLLHPLTNFPPPFAVLL